MQTNLTPAEIKDIVQFIADRVLDILIWVSALWFCAIASYAVLLNSGFTYIANAITKLAESPHRLTATVSISEPVKISTLNGLEIKGHIHATTKVNGLP